MNTLFCFGYGYTARHYVSCYRYRFERVIATVRDGARAVAMNGAERPWLSGLAFDGVATASIDAAIADATEVLVSVPPDAAGDAVLAVCGDWLARAASLRSVVYLSTLGVYGDHQGAWVDEASECRAGAERNRQRRAAELAWQDFGQRSGVAVAILRLAAIYGPERNALVGLERGIARRIAKPGQVFNRIHVADIAGAIDQAFARRADGIFNVADDEPSPPGDPIAFAARLLGRAEPPEIPFAEAALSMSEFAASFYAESKRARNAKLKSVLGVKLQFPTYRDGLAALYLDGAAADT